MESFTVSRRKPARKSPGNSIGSIHDSVLQTPHKIGNHRLNKFTCLGVICVFLLSVIMPSVDAFPSQSRGTSIGEGSTSSRKDKSLDFANLEMFASADYNNLSDDIDTVYYDQLGSESVKNFASNYGGLAEDAELSANDDMSRSRPTSIRGDGNSPIYYIRLPPTPYMFVPGVGYVSQPPNLRLPPVVQPDQSHQSHQSPILNVPLNFMSNGKPTGIYTIEHDKPVWPKPVPQSNPWQAQPVAQSNPAQSWQWQQNEAPSWQRPSQNEIRPPSQKPQKQKPQNGDSNLYYLNKGPYKFNGRPTDIFFLRNAYDSLYSDTLQSFYP